jgi:hypothetical protein
MKQVNVFIGIALAGVLSVQAFGQPATGKDSPNTEKGVQTTVSQEWFKMGDLRLLNNDWGSKSLNCTTPYRVFIENDGSFGWEFTRGKCGGDNASPDYPEIEFGIHPFGTAKDLVTSPDFSSTALLPIQIKDVTSMSVRIDQLNVQLQNAASWNSNFEMWVTDQHPVTGSHSCPVAEIMVFWGWQNGRWPCDQDGSLQAGTDTYSYCHDTEGWGCGWRYTQFRVNGGPKTGYNGTLDVKAILDWMVNQKGFSRDLWVSRLEIGTEMGDNTSGKVTIRNLTFEVNGTSKSPEFFDPSAIHEHSPVPQASKPGPALIPAGTTVEFVNLQGVRQRLGTGSGPKTAGELGRRLTRGVYLMYRLDRNGGRVKHQAVVVPVL